MSNFGHRVIGHEKAAEEVVIEKARANHFGPRVIGDVLAARLLAERKDEGAGPAAPDTRSDPAKKKAKREKAAEQRAESEIETIEAPTTTNLEELQAALEGNPAFYEQLYDAEYNRAAGPRKSALRMFLVFEMEHEDREDRKTDIEAALNPKG